MDSSKNTALLPLLYHKSKRKRGGQKGNRNALKHGFYARHLGTADICELWNIVNMEGLEPEIAVLRIKLRSLLERDPANRRVLGEASKLLARYYSSKFGLNKTQRLVMNNFVNGILRNQSKLSSGLAELPQAQPVILKNESSVH